MIRYDPVMIRYDPVMILYDTVIIPLWYRYTVASDNNECQAIWADTPRFKTPKLREAKDLLNLT